jgi:hypothetical protein
VLQGSLLSPHLFNIYVNDMVDHLTPVTDKNNLFLYADDILIVTCGRSTTVDMIRSLEEWSASAGLEINSKKCGVI